MGAYMWVYLAVLLSVQSLTEAAQCGLIADCDDTNGECLDGVCFCKADFMGTECKDTCSTAACSGTQVCTGNSVGDCAECNPLCTGTATCATVDTTPTCKQYCTPDPCKNSGTCSTTDGTCTCTADWTGPTCEIAATTCGTGGKCATTEGDCVDDVCYCKALAYGPHCADTCAVCTTSGQVCTGASACAACNPGCDANKEKCATVDTTATCKCIDGLSGANCETITCDGNVPCMNGGTCASNICTCDKDHAGFICEKECAPACTVNTEKCVESSGNPVCKAKCGAGTECQNGGSCTADELCNCAAGWEGDLCEKAEAVCEPACTEAQKCVEEDGSKICKATCANNDACKNNGTCANELCTCAEGWTGDLCTESGASSVVPSVLSMALFLLVIRL